MVDLTSDLTTWFRAPLPWPALSLSRSPPELRVWPAVQVRFVDDPELAYVAVRSREVHDFWHVLFDCPTTVTGELALKMLEFVQVSGHRSHWTCPRIQSRF